MPTPAGVPVAITSPQFSIIPFEIVEIIFGHEIWPYGLSSNKTTLEKMIFYAQQQGVISRSLEVQELFAESVIDD